MTDEEIKKVAEMLNAHKCFRHQFYPATRRCRLCDAKRESKGHFEYARKIFIKGNYGT